MDRRNFVRLGIGAGAWGAAAPAMAADAGDAVSGLGMAADDIAYGTQTVASALDALQLADYEALRAYSGPRKSFYVTGYMAMSAPSGIAGPFVIDDSDTTSADNGGTIIVLANGKRAKRVYSGAVYVDWFGPVGDGTTAYDTLPIRQAIRAAGVSGRLRFTAGKTYLNCGRLVPLAGQTWEGYGAVLKRCRAVSSATLTAIDAGSSPTIVQVADASQFRIGMDVTIFNGEDFDANNHAIVAINGDQLTLETNFDRAFPLGGTVISSFLHITAVADDIRIFGLEIDGNKAENTLFAKWQNHAEIYISSDRGTVSDCYVHDAQCEGIEVGGMGVKIIRNVIVDSAGNGIHMSGSSGALIQGNHVKNANLAGVSTGHADGCISFSNVTGDTFVSGNYLENGIAGVGSIDSDDNSGVIISGNIIRNCTSYVLDMVSSGLAQGRVIFAGNQCYSSGDVALRKSGAYSSSQGAYSVKVSDNYFENCTATVASSRDISFRGNEWVWTLDTTTTVVSIKSSTRVTFDDAITGGGFGVYVEGAESAQVRVRGRFRNQFKRAINLAQASCGEVRGASVVAEAGQVSEAYEAIALATGNSAMDCDINVLAGKYGIVFPAGGPGVAGAHAQNNTIRSAAGIPSMKMWGGSRNNIAVNNFIQQPISNGGGVSNKTAPNFKIL